MAVRDLLPWNQSRSPSVRSPDGHPLWALNREMNRLFDEFWHDFDMPSFGGRFLGGAGRSSSWPSVEIAETDKELKVQADLPGLDEKDVEVLLTDGVLIIRGEKKSETDDKERHFSERFYGRFERQIPLMTDVDEQKVAALFKDGVLTVTIPKSQKAQENTKRIPINQH